MVINPYQIIKELNFERLAGSENERRAAAIISEHLNTLGLKCRKEEFELTTFATGKGVLKVGDSSFEVFPYGLNTDCRVEAELVFLENAEILKQNKGMYKGKIVISNGYSRTIQEALKEQELAAFIAIGPPCREAPSSSHRQKTFQDGIINSATISYENGVKLSKIKGKKALLEMTQQVSRKTAANLIVDIKGSEPDKNLTYLVAHYDSVARTAGASDNAGGTVSLLSVAEHFVNHKPKRNLRLIFFSGEELGLLGSQHYVSAHEEEVKKEGSLVLNIDVSGDPVGMNRVIVTGSKELLGYSEGILNEADHCLSHSLDIYSSDQMPFTRLELPGLSIARFGGKGSFNIHTPADHYKNISIEGLKTPIAAAKILLNRILNAGIYPVKRTIDSSLKEKIEKYLWNLNFEEPTLKWEPKYKG
jgi:hypothetical protein